MKLIEEPGWDELRHDAYARTEWIVEALEPETPGDHAEIARLYAMLAQADAAALAGGLERASYGGFSRWYSPPECVAAEDALAQGASQEQVWQAIAKARNRVDF